MTTSPPPGAGLRPVRATHAAGLKALVVTYQGAARHTGVLRGLRVLSQANQRGGFDCPGCAWPDPAERTLFEFCENGAKAILDEATGARVDEFFVRKHSLDELKRGSDRFLNDCGRIVTPLILRPGQTHFEAITYDAALTLIADELTALDSPNQAAFYTSGRASNEAAYLYQLLARSLGTNNLPDCSNLCHESSGVALKESLGIGKGTVRLSDFQKADLIVVIGQNPGSNHPRMLSALQAARDGGATVVSVNPLIETGLVAFAHPQDPAEIAGGGHPVSDHFFRVQVGGDQALFRGVAKYLLHESGASGIDRPFIDAFTEGFTDYEAEVRQTSWSAIEEASGLKQDEVERLAKLIQSSRRMICTWAMGLTQHVHAVDTIHEVVNVLLMGGHMGRPGAGACPVRGHSNVQGDRTVGIATSLTEARYRALEERFQFSASREPGLDTVGTIQALLSGKVTHFVSLGGNFLAASPDTEVTQQALKKAKLSVQIATKLNRSHLHTGGTLIVLPCLGRTETDQGPDGPRFVTVENSMGVVHSSQGRMRPAHLGLRSEATIVSQLAQKVEQARAQRDEEKAPNTIPWQQFSDDYDAIRSAIEGTVSGFERFNDRVREPDGIELPNGPRERRFTTQSGKAVFFSHALEKPIAKEGELILTTVRSHDQFNTTVYTDDDRYRGIRGNRRVILVHPEELTSRGLAPGQLVDLESRFCPLGETRDHTRHLTGFTALPYDVPRGLAVTYFPEANPLIFLESFARRSRTPTSKSVRLAIQASPSGVPGHSSSTAERKVIKKS